MRKISLKLIMVFASILVFGSCQQDVEVWDSETLDYSGRYIVKLANEDMSTIYHDYDGSELRIYNTSSNLANQIWMEDLSKLIPLKCKFEFQGTPASFVSTNTEFDKLTNNLNSISLPQAKENVSEPTAEGQTAEVDRDYLRATVIEGKIIPKAVTTKGGNIADSLYLKVKLYSGKAIFKSIRKAEKEWKDPTKPEFTWVFSSVTYDATKDEVLVIGGYSYTGFEEDDY